MATVAENLQTLAEIKGNIRTAISDKGVDIPETTPFSEYPTKINEISGGGTDELFNQMLAHTLTEVHSTTPISKGQYLFFGQDNLRIADINLPGGSYMHMFADCTSLTTAPELPSTELTTSCYYYMFEYCTSLTKAPDLPSTRMVLNCYNSMFANCKSLTEAPALPSTELADSCYYYMFSGCTGLTTTTDLPATEIPYSAYIGMFNGCTALQKTGKIAATGNISNSTSSMFQNCTSLRETTWTATTPPIISTSIWTNCPADMVIYVPDEAVDKYKEASVWSERAEYIKPMSERPE